MIDYIKVHCPQCGKGFDVKIVVRSAVLSAGSLEVGYWGSVVEHICEGGPRV